MNDLVVKIQITVYEADASQNLDSIGFHIASSTTNRVILGSVREAAAAGKIKDIVDIVKREISHGTEWLKRNLFKQVKVPLNICLKDKKEEIISDLVQLIPSIKFNGYFSDGKFHIYSIRKDPYKGECIDITHPIDGQYLTTKYTDMYEKLSDGSWTYVYQTHVYYEGIIEKVPAPFDEKVFADYFKGKGIEFELSTYNLLPIPDPRPPIEEDWD